MPSPILATLAVACAFTLLADSEQAAASGKPDILVIWGDDVTRAPAAYFGSS